MMKRSILYCLLFGITLILLSNAYAISSTNDIATTRIISLQPAVTDTFVRLGMEKYLVGVSDYCQFSNKQVTRVGGLYNPNLERIIRCKPDIVFLHPSQTELIAQLKEIRIETIPISTGTFSDVFRMIESCIKCVSLKDDSNSLILSMKKLNAKIGEISIEEDKATPHKPKTLFVVANDHHSFPVFVAAPHSYHGSLLALSGAENVINSNGRLSSIPLSAEQFIRLSPDNIIDISFDDNDSAGEFYKSFSTIPAVKQQHIYGMKSYQMETPGFSAIDAITSISAVLKTDSRN